MSWSGPPIEKPFDASLFDFEALFELRGKIIEPVPIDERGNYRYWRAAHLGRIGLNFATGRNDLNAGRDTVAHFAETYRFAHSAAQSLLSGLRKTQFDKIAGFELGSRLQKPTDTIWPVIVMALDERFNEVKLVPSQHGSRHGLTHTASYLTLDMIDPQSREFIQSFLPESGQVQ